MRLCHRHAHLQTASLAAIALALLSTGAAFSQTVATAPSVNPASQVPEVVVTAQKRTENIQNVPIQITAYSATQLNAANVKTTQDVLNITPNVTMDHSFTFLNSFVVIRGVAEINNADSPLSIVVDGVPQNNQKQALQDLFDVQQVEVLRGPQGSLYGRNAIGGAMIITTEAPTNIFKGYGQFDYGNGDYINGVAAISGPVVKDLLLFRLSADIKSDGGLIENTYLDKKVDKIDYDDTVRGQLLFKPTSTLTVDLRASYNDFKGGATYDSVVFSGNANDIEPPTSDILGKSYGYVTDTTLKVEERMPFATLTSITGYTQLKEDYRGSLDFTNPINNPGGFLGLYGPLGQGQNLNDQNLSEEVRLTSPSNQRFRWVAGLYGVLEDRGLLTRAWVNSPLSEFGTPAFYNPPQSVLNSFAGFGIPSQVLIDRGETDHNDAYAVFGQVDYDLTRQFTVTGGFRYDENTRRQIDDVGGGPQKSATFSSPQPKVTLTYKFDPRLLAYVTYSTGFRSGGFNAPGISIPEFKAETLTNYEIGFKSDLFDRRLTFNGDYYFAVDHNFQFFYVQASTGSQIISNIDAVHLSGVEFEAQAHPFAGLNLSAGVGTTDSDVTRSSIYPEYVGNKTPKTIPYKVDLAAQYEHSVVEGWNGMIRIDYTHKDHEYWQLDNADVQKSLDLVNGRLGVSHERFGLYLYVKNLTNQRYYEDYNPSQWSGLPYDIGSLAEPRTYGLEATARF